MKTSKVILLVASLFLAINSNAQEKQTTFGIKAGLNVSNVGTDEGRYNNTKSRAGIHAGFFVDHAFAPMWHLVSGLEYTAKGVNVELSSNDQHITAAYVQLPILGGFRFQITDEFAVLAHLGPYFAYGIHGKIKQGNYQEDTFSDYALKRFDSGLTFNTGIEWQKLLFLIGGESGFVNVMQSNNDKAENRNFTLSVGYRF